MSTAAGASSGDSSWVRFATRAAHWHPTVVGAGGAVSLIGMLSGLPSVASAGCFAVLASYLFSLRHQWRLCLTCAAATPLDPDAAVQRYRRALAFTHRSTWLQLGTQLTFLVALLGTIAVFNYWPAAQKFAAWTFLIGLVVFYLDMVVEGYAHLRHRPLQPWCPWCDDWDDDGDEEPSPEPTPTPAVEVAR